MENETITITIERTPNPKVIIVDGVYCAGKKEVLDAVRNVTEGKLFPKKEG